VSFASTKIDFLIQNLFIIEDKIGGIVDNYYKELIAYGYIYLSLIPDDTAS
jgi:hypothetical protein